MKAQEIETDSRKSPGRRKQTLLSFLRIPAWIGFSKGVRTTEPKITNSLIKQLDHINPTFLIFNFLILWTWWHPKNQVVKFLDFQVLGWISLW